MTSESEIGFRITPGAVVRRRPGLLSRATASGYLLHPGDRIVPVTGAGAEVWAQLVDEVPVGELVDRRAVATGRDHGDVAAEVLGAVAHLEQCRAVEVVPE